MIARIALLLTFVPLGARAEKAVPPAPAGFVYNEGVIRPETEAKLSKLLERSMKATKHPVYVALFRGLNGQPLADFTSRVYRGWRIGLPPETAPKPRTPSGDAEAAKRLGPAKDKEGDGLLFCLFLRDRRWRIEVGYQLAQSLPEARAMELVRSSGEPYFERGRIDAGVYVSAAALAEELGAPASIDESSRPFVLPPAAPARGGVGDAVWGGAAIFFTGAGIVYFAWLFLDAYWEKKKERPTTRQP